MKVRGMLGQSLALIRERYGVVRADDLSHTMLRGWIEEDIRGCLPEVTAARYAPMLLFDHTPEDSRIPLKVFVYAYDRYGLGASAGREPGNWLDGWAELRFVQFQYLLRLARLARRTRQGFPLFNLFDFGNYDCLLDDAAPLDRDGQLRNMLPLLLPRIDCVGKPS